MDIKDHTDRTIYQFGFNSNLSVQKSTFVEMFEQLAKFVEKMLEKFKNKLNIEEINMDNIFN